MTTLRTLRSSLIRLAHTQPDLRPHLLPLLKAANNYPTVTIRGVECHWVGGPHESMGGMVVTWNLMRGKDPMVTLTHSQHQPMGGAAEKPYWDCMAFVGPDRHGDYMPYTNPSKLRAGEGYEDGLEDAMRRGFEFFMRMQIRWETSQLRRGLPVP